MSQIRSNVDYESLNISSTMMITVMTKGRGDGSNNDNKSSGNGCINECIKGDTLNRKP